MIRNDQTLLRHVFNGFDPEFFIPANSNAFSVFLIWLHPPHLQVKIEVNFSRLREIALCSNSSDLRLWRSDNSYSSRTDLVTIFFSIINKLFKFMRPNRITPYRILQYTKWFPQGRIYAQRRLWFQNDYPA